jgi:hypothetical protein
VFLRDGRSDVAGSNAWIVRSLNDLRGIAYLYELAATKLEVVLDDMLERSEVPPGRQLESLITFLRQKPAPTVGNFNSLATVATKALSIRSLLLWAADPANQGNSRRKSIQQFAEERAMLMAIFHPLERYALCAERIRPLLPNEVEGIDSLCSAQCAMKKVESSCHCVSTIQTPFALICGCETGSWWRFHINAVIVVANC